MRPSRNFMDQLRPVCRDATWRLQERAPCLYDADIFGLADFCLALQADLECRTMPNPEACMRLLRVLPFVFCSAPGWYSYRAGTRARVERKRP